VAIEPVEYNNKRIVRYYGYKITGLNMDRLVKAIANTDVLDDPDIWEDSGTICYQYPRKPLIAIKDGKLYTTWETWQDKKFTKKQIRHQASILLRILYKHGFATYNRRSVSRTKFTPHKWVELKKQMKLKNAQKT